MFQEIDKPTTPNSLRRRTVPNSKRNLNKSRLDNPTMVPEGFKSVFPSSLLFWGTTPRITPDRRVGRTGP